MPDEAAIRAKLTTMAGWPDAAWVVAAKELFASWRPTVAEAIRFLGTQTATMR
jgi:hypothetical protein